MITEITMNYLVHQNLCRKSGAWGIIVWLWFSKIATLAFVDGAEYQP